MKHFRDGRQPEARELFTP